MSLTHEFDTQSKSPSKEENYAHALTAFDDGEHGMARNYLKDVLQEDPSNEAAFDLLVKTSHDNNPARSLRESSYTLLKKFRATENTQHLLNALEIADLTIINDNELENDRNYYVKAAIYRELGEPAESIRHLELALEHNPDHEPSQKLMARMKIELGIDSTPITNAYNDQAATKDRSTRPYTPSPADSAPADLAAAIDAMNPWNLG